MLGRNGMRRLGASILGLLLSVGTADIAAAQTAATVTGRVTAEGGQPLFGANVTIEALAISVGTNEEGRYTIAVPGARVRGQQVVLRVRSFGYVPDQKTITLEGGSQSHDFTLKQDVNRLSQVVVTGVTGATEVKKLPFTVAQVTAEDMPVPGANPLSQIQGKVPGANIVSASGRPGTAPAIILRGPQSINASGRGQDPLYIIDGVISQGGIQDINPQDIENIEVVKGAAASSLYGSRAGNGVIQITTRSGRNSGEGIRFRSQIEYGTQSIENEYKYPRTNFLTMTKDYDNVCVTFANQPNSGATAGTNAARDQCNFNIDLYDEALYINQNGQEQPLATWSLMGDGGISVNPGAVGSRALYQTNYYERTFNPIRQYLTNGESYNTTVDATGRISRTNFFASANQFRQEGAVRFLRGYTRNALRLNVDQQMATAWNFSVRTSYTDAVDYNNAASWFSLTRQNASVDLLRRDNQGRLFIRSVIQAQGTQNSNPAYVSEQFQPINRISRYLNQATVRWQPLSWLDAEANFGFDGRSNHSESLTIRGFRNISGAINQGSVNRGSNRSYSLNSSLDVTARRSFMEDNLSARATFRYLFEGQDDRGLSTGGSNLAAFGVDDADIAVQGQFASSYMEQVRQIGMFGNVDLDWKGKYIASALIRRDGASLFGSANRWQTYGRGSFAWRASEEEWFAFDAISDLKFRASIGQAGNRPPFAAQYETFGVGGGGALIAGQIGNPLLRPEVSTETEVGFDAEILSKYALTVTYAKNVIDGQIMPVPLSYSTGFQSQWRNVGELTNNTYEVSLNIPILQTRDLNYSARINWDRTTSEISRLDIPEFFVSAAGQQGSEQMFKIVQGGQMGEIYGRRFVQSCGELVMPAGSTLTCGGAGSDFQRNSDGFIVYVGQGNTLGDGITKNLWFTRLPAAQAPWSGGTTAENLSWGMPILVRDATGAVPVLPVGQALPDYRWALSQQFGYKKFTAYLLLDATVGKNIWNIGRQWSLGDFMQSSTDQAGRSVQSAKPVGYYFRAQSTGGIGGLYDVLGPNNYTVEDASFVKVRELALGYRIGRIMGVGDWTVNIIGRNLLTFSDYQGFDPEVGLAGGNLGSGVLNAIDGYTFPNLRTFSFQIATSF